MSYLTFDEYKSHSDKTIDINEDNFNRIIFDVELAIDEFTYHKLRDEWFFNNLKDFQKKLLKKAMVKSVEWWFKRELFINNYGGFTSMSVGELDVEIPSAYEDDPTAFLQAIKIPEIAKSYLTTAGLRYARI